MCAACRIASTGARAEATAMHICVYCGSHDEIGPVYHAAARALGELIGRHGHTLVWGGGGTGIMGALAQAAQGAGAQVIGVIPRMFVTPELIYAQADQLIVTETMAERKVRLMELAEGFIALPGGLGTLEEIADTISLNLLGAAPRPLAILNTDGFYGPLLAQFERYITLGFALSSARRAYRAVADPADALAWVEAGE